ncbi:MAG: hypothetical protein ACI4LB_02535 [Candidatus Fimenecus sp.]
MKKSTKLLSVLLAIVMIFSSMSVMASATRTSYQTSDDLVDLKAYSPYGQVTRLSTEERLSIFCDYLDIVLDNPSLNMGTVINTLGITLTINLTSVNNICATLDSVKSVKSNILVSAISWMLGIVNDLDVSSWQSGVNRDSSGDTAHITIVTNLLKVINDNKTLIADILRTGEVDLGVASSAVAGLDLSMIADIPGLIKGMIFPLFERWDDTIARCDELATKTAGDGNFESVLNTFVQGLLTKDMSITTYIEDSAGNCISSHTLPTTADTRTYYVRSGDEFIRYDYNTETKAHEEIGRYVKTELLDAEDNGTGEYVFVKTDEDGNEDTLVYYQDNSPALRSLKAAIDAGTASVDLTTNSALELAYTFIPYLLDDLAIVPANGSLKKVLAEWFGASFTYIGEVGSEEGFDREVPNDTFFSQEKGWGPWGWSDYKVIDGVHYYRFENQVYVSDLSNINPYFDMINWDYEITSDMLTKYIPTADTADATSAAGYTRIVHGLNDFLIDIVDEVLAPDFRATLNLTRGDNSNLVANIKEVAQAVVEVSPASIFGSNYADPDKYYNLLISDNNDEVLVGIACTLVDLLMPQMILPTADKLAGTGVKVGAILAAVIRELATQLIPNYNYDALIYSDYNTKTFVSGKDNSYWLDVILTMGADIGIHYLRNLADMGEDTDVWSTGMDYPDTKTYTEADLKLDQDVNAWEAKVDYIIDWALSNDYEWTWKMENLVDVTGLTIDLGTVQNPWEKLGKIFADLLPIDQLLNVDTSNANWLETTLRDNFVLALADLQLEKIVGKDASNLGVLNLPATTVLRNDNLLSQLVIVIRDLLNGLVYKIAGNVTLIPTSITTLDAVFNQTNICNVVETLLGCLDEANDNGLFDTAMPLLNMFVGWKTSAQYFAKPTISLKNPSDATYAYTGEAQTITVLNNASGMLEKHRKNGSYDGSYNIIIEDITATNGSVAFTAGQVIAPGASASLTYTPSSTEGAARIEVKYQVQFKDGTSIGGDQYAYFFTYVTNTATDIPKSQTMGDGSGSSWAYTKAYYSVGRYTNNPDAIATIIDNIYISIENTSIFGTGGTNNSYTGFDANYVAATGNTYGGQSKQSTVSLYPAKSVEGADYAGIESGTAFALGTVVFRATWGAYKGNYSINLGNFYYANTMELEELFDSVANNGYQRAYFDDTADAEWAELLAAMDQASVYVKAPKLTSTFTSVYTQENIDAAYTRLDNAIKALAKKPSSAATAAGIETAVDTAQGEKGINYQDYKLYEYFDFHDTRNDAYNRIAEYDTPKAPENRIEGSALSADEIAALIAAEGNEKKQLALNATVIEPTEEEMEAYAVAMENYKAPTYTILDNEDLAMKVTYYGNLVIANTTNKQFLAKEIAYANAQNYDASKYSADSWAAYTNALAAANEVNNDADALQSEVFDAKYALMKAENELLLKEKSAKETGALTDLEGLVAIANTIFANPDDYTVVDGVTETEAYAALIKALGYSYTDEAGNEAILYSHSALSFLKYDRETTTSNLNRIDAAEQALVDAIANFVSTIQVIASEVTTGGVVDVANRFVYGVNPGDVAANYFEATSGGTLTWTTGAACSENGTGAVATLTNKNGDVVAIYTLVIFGDVNGDGAIDAFDASILDMELSGKTTLSDAFAAAGDAAGADDEIALADYSAVVNYAIGAGTIAQTR